jgi:hypothetical protein
VDTNNTEIEMTKKRRKISEIAEEMFQIINEKPTKKEIKELASILNVDESEEGKNEQD